ncbi:hypothetical protein GF358_01445 [Candidatus Woesearchaeota archaeon]|nr:hypothetical protein [Candidatus Woesearchaeota archaeon]
MVAKKKSNSAKSVDMPELPNAISLSQILRRLLPEEAQSVIGNRKISLKVKDGPPFVGSVEMATGRVFLDKTVQVYCGRRKIGRATFEMDIAKNVMRSMQYDLTIEGQRYNS